MHGHHLVAGRGALFEHLLEDLPLERPLIRVVRYVIKSDLANEPSFRKVLPEKRTLVSVGLDKLRVKTHSGANKPRFLDKSLRVGKYGRGVSDGDRLNPCGFDQAQKCHRVLVQVEVAVGVNK